MAKKHVFISYNHKNAKAVSQLRGDLVAAGEQVWWDQDILPGQDWTKALRQAVKDAYAFVLCLSKEATSGPTSGVYPEARDAIRELRKYAPGGIFLIPVRLSKCEIPQLEIDDTTDLDSLQYVDLFPPAKRADGLDRLVRALQATPLHP